MYQIHNKEYAIREIQRFLVTISQVEDSLPHVTVDGFYSDETRLTVTEFQKISGIEPTGMVDYETFNAIYTRHAEILKGRENKNNVYSAFEYPLERGDNNNSVLILNGMLRILAEHYEIKPPEDNSYFSSDTSDAVVYLKGVFGLPAEESVDIEFMNILSDEILARQKFKKRL